MKRSPSILLGIAAVALVSATAPAQLGRQMGLIDPNVATEAQLVAVPHMNAAIAKALMEKRPFMNVVELNTWLLTQGLTQEQLARLVTASLPSISRWETGRTRPDPRGLHLIEQLLHEHADRCADLLAEYFPVNAPIPSGE